MSEFKKTPTTFKMIQSGETKFYKGNDGWTGKTNFIDAEAKPDQKEVFAVEVHTWKTSRGLESSYSFGKEVTWDSNGRKWTSWQCILCVDETGTLAKSAERCTEKSIRNLHAQGLEAFKAKFAENFGQHVANIVSIITEGLPVASQA
jgi:hypothetical protein